MHEVIALVAGFAIGVIGTLVGVGGGFFIVPALTILFPAWPAREITAYSLAVVCANACSGTLAYLQQRRVDVRSLAPFAAATIPGAVLGVFGTNVLPRAIFDPLFGGLVACMAAWLFFAPKPRVHTRQGGVARELTDRAGTTYRWSFDMRIAVAGNVAVGAFSALFGIGGGPVQVPFLIAVLGYPEHIATATSHAILAITSLVSSAVHGAQGDYATDALPVATTCLGAIGGAPVGARLSRHVPGTTLVRILAVMLAFIAVRLLFATAFR